MDSGISVDLLMAEAKGIVRKVTFRCPEAFLDTDIAKLPDKESYEKAMAWVYGSKGMVFIGETGSGKSRSLWLLLNRLANDGVDFISIRASDFANEAAENYKNGWGAGWRRKMETTPLLALDDLGNAPQGERGEGELFEVVKNRLESMLPVIVTTQKVGDDFKKSFRDEDRAVALVRRLRESCTGIKFTKEA